MAVVGPYRELLNGWVVFLFVLHVWLEEALSYTNTVSLARRHLAIQTLFSLARRHLAIQTLFSLATNCEIPNLLVEKILLFTMWLLYFPYLALGSTLCKQ